MKIKKGDTVQVLSGNDKGKTGEVLEVIPKTGKVVVKGANVRKKHVKPRKQGEEGGILSVECGMPISKVNVVCPKCGKTTKVGYKEEKDEKSNFIYGRYFGEYDVERSVSLESYAGSRLGTE